MELFPVQTGQIWMCHEEEVAGLCLWGMLCQGWGLHAAKCQSHYMWPRPGFCLDFACRDGAPLECQVLPTLPGFPVKCQIAAAAPGWNSLPRPCGRPGRMQGAVLGSCPQFCPQFPALGSQTPQCPGRARSPNSCVCLGHRAQKEFLLLARVTSLPQQRGAEPLQ